MLPKVKQALRIKSDSFDDEILDLIEAANLDLQVSGINVSIDDKLIQRAVVVYCKANFGLENNDSEKFTKAYEHIKTLLGLAGKYNGSI